MKKRTKEAHPHPVETARELRGGPSSSQERLSSVLVGVGEVKPSFLERLVRRPRGCRSKEEVLSCLVHGTSLMSGSLVGTVFSVRDGVALVDVEVGSAGVRVVKIA